MNDLTITAFELTDIEKELYTPVYEKYGVYETDFNKNLLKLPTHRLIDIFKVIDNNTILHIVENELSINLEDFAKTGLYVTFNDNLILLNSKQKEIPKIKELMKKYIESESDTRYEMECQYEYVIKSTELDNDVDKRRETSIHNIVTYFISVVLRIDKEEWIYGIEKRRYEKYNPIAEIVSLNRYDYNIYEFAKYIADNCNCRFGGIRSDIYNCFLAGMVVGKREERAKRQVSLVRDINSQ